MRSGEVASEVMDDNGCTAIFEIIEANLDLYGRLLSAN